MWKYDSHERDKLDSREHPDFVIKIIVLVREEPDGILEWKTLNEQMFLFVLYFLEIDF